jgi:hypothetical protein
MTLVCAWTQNSIAYLAADYAHIDASTGLIGALAPKMVRLDATRAAIGLTGVGGFDALLAAVDRVGPRTFKQLDHAFVDILGEYLTIMRPHCEAKGFEPWARLTMAAWDSLHRQPTVQVVGSCAELSPPGLEAFDVGEGPYALGASFHPASLFGENFDPMNRRQFAKPQLRRLFQRQRETPHSAIAAYPAHHSIGGAVDMLRISQSGVKIERVMEWPDKIGAAIDPMLSPCETVACCEA